MRGTLAMMLLALILMANKCRVTESFGLDMIGNIQTTFNFFNDAYGVVQGDLPVSSLLTGSTGVMLDKILASVGDISGQIDELSATFTDQLQASDMRNAKRFQAVQAAMEQVMTEIPKKGKLNEDMREFRAYTSRVNSLYREFEYYSQNRTHFNEQTINYFIEAIVSRDRGDLSDILQQMFNLVIQEDWYYTQGIMELYAHSIRTTDTEKLCGVGLSPQVRYYKMYETIYMAEARGFIMQLFAYSVKSAYTRTTYLGELELTKTLMLARIEKYFLGAMNQMRGLQKVVELCDAPKYEPGIDYIITAPIRRNLWEDPNSYHPSSSISMIEKKANVEENMVVSGIRFVKLPNGLIDYQIKAAKLLPQGQVAPNGTWQELPEMVEDPVKYLHYYTVLSGDVIGIDDLTLDPGYVVVGVSFEVTIDYKHTFLLLVICGMKFDATTGQLDQESETCIYPSEMDNTTSGPYYERERIKKRIGSKNPRRADRNFIDIEPNGGVILNVTKDHIDTLDSATDPIVPFFDARPVEMGLPNFALSGMGLYHRGAEGYGGFLNFRLHNIDLADYMQQHDIIETSTDNP